MKKILKDSEELLFHNMGKLITGYTRKSINEAEDKSLNKKETLYKRLGFSESLDIPVSVIDRNIKQMEKRNNLSENDEKFLHQLISAKNLKESDKKITLNEAIDNDTYFETLSGALDSVRQKVERKGYTVDEDEMFTQFGTGGISYGETKRANISLLKDGIRTSRRNVTIAIYRMDSGKYELTAYIN